MLLILFLLVGLQDPTESSQTDVNVRVALFWEIGCQHCTEAANFLSRLQGKYPWLEIASYEVLLDPENAKVLERVSHALANTQLALPLVIVGNQFVSGYVKDETTGRKIEALILNCQASSCPDLVAQFLLPEDKPQGFLFEPVFSEGEEIIDLPLFGSIDTQKRSLLYLALVLGLADGFNPCAMWVLCFLLSLLISTRSRKKMVLVGSLFLLTSTLVYFLFMSAWLNIFLTIGLLAWMRWLIGCLAILAGLLQLKDFFWFGSGPSLSISESNKKGLIARMRRIVYAGTLPALLTGTLLLAVTVNLVELLCTAGLPAIFTRILSLNPLSWPQYYGYMAVYLLMYMLDDLILFVMVTWSFNPKKLTERGGRWLKLFSGLLITLLGVLLTFRPNALMFG